METVIDDPIAEIFPGGDIAIELNNALAFVESLYSAAGQLISTAVEIEGGTVYRKQININIQVDEVADSIYVKPSSELQFKFNPTVVSTGSGGTYSAGSWPTGPSNSLGLGKIISLSRPWRIVRINGSGSHDVALYRKDGNAIADEETISGKVNYVFTQTFISQYFHAATESAISSVDLAAYPTGPKVMLGQPSWGTTNALEETLTDVLWQEPGEHHSSAEMRLTAEMLSNKIASVANPALSSRPSGETILTIPIIVQSDIPCKLETLKNQFSYELQINRFPDQDKKKVIRFNGASKDKKQIVIPWPNAGSYISKFDWEICESLQEGTNDIEINNNSDPSANDLTQHKGILITPDQKASTIIILENAMKISGVSLALASVDKSIEIFVELFSDFNGKPHGEMLSQGNIEFSHIGARRWFNVRWQDKILPSGYYWITVRSAKGRALWLGENDENVEVIQTEIGTEQLDRSAGSKIAKFSSRYKLIASENSSNNNVGTRSATVVIKESKISSTQLEGDKKIFHLSNIASDVEAFLNETSVDIVSDSKSVVTFYAPIVRYSIE